MGCTGLFLSIVAFRPRHVSESSPTVGVMRGRAALSRHVGVGLATVALLAGCTSQQESPDAASELLFSPEATADATASPTPTVTPEATLPALANDCRGVIRTEDLVTIVAVPLPGETTFVFADALPDIGRTGRVTCGYGDEGDGPKVEVTINDYESEQAAADRIDVTLQAATERGNEITPQAVGPYDGYVIGDSDDVSIVVDAGTRTVVVTMNRGLVGDAAEVVVLERLAATVLGLPTDAQPLEP
jgi:hypothetical protein